MRENLNPGSRWLVVAGAFITQTLVIGGMFSYGIFFTVFEETFGWSRTILSASTSLAFLIMGLGAVIVGRLNDKFGPKWVLTTTGLTCGMGYVLMSSISEPWQLMIYFGVFVGIGLSSHDVVTLSTVTSWFERRRGVITGFVKTGAACGQTTIPVLTTLLLASMHWRSALLWLGLMTGIGLVVVAQFMSKSKSSNTVVRSNNVVLPGVSLIEAKGTATLWTMCAIQFCFFPTLITIPLHIVPHAKDLGMSTTSAATVLSALGASSILGRLAVGFLFDRVGGKLALKTCLVFLGASLISLLLIERVEYLYLFAFFYGCSHGGLFTVVSPTIAEYFGMRAHGAIFGTIVMFGTLGAAGGPILAGLIFDYYGSYTLAIQIFVFLLCAALILTAWLKPVITSVVDSKV